MPNNRALADFPWMTGDNTPITPADVLAGAYRNAMGAGGGQSQIPQNNLGGRLMQAGFSDPQLSQRMQQSQWLFVPGVGYVPIQTPQLNPDAARRIPVPSGQPDIQPIPSAPDYYNSPTIGWRSPYGSA
jgi:hypothetical protein